MKKIFGLLLITTLVISPINTVQAKQNVSPEITVDSDSDSSIPPEIIEKAYSKVTNTAIPNVKAFERDEQNVLKPVPIISQSNKISLDSILKVPYDPYGYTYDFDYYSPDYVKRDWHYGIVSIYRCKNALSTPATATYKLESTTTTTGSASLSITGKTEVKAAFLAKLEVTAGFTGTFSKTWNKGWSATTESTVPARSTAYLTNYQVGVNSNGAVIYKKRTPTGAVCGQYIETGGGTVLSKNDINIEITETEPLY